MLTFMGYPRKNGSVGTRNAVLVISGDLCCNPWSLRIASGIDNCYAITHKHGVGNYAPDRALFKRLFEGISTNPNCAGFVYVSSGNEDHAPDDLIEKASREGVPFAIVSARRHSSGGPLVRECVEAAGKLIDTVSSLERTESAVDRLIVGLNCAGTDTASERMVHPVLGRAADMLVQAGATVVLSETPDLIGLDCDLFDRCQRSEDRDRLIAMYKLQHQRLGASGEKIDDIEMVAFNTEGGLKTLKHKASVSILKAGSATIREVVEYGAPISQTGLVFMDGPAMTDYVMAGYMSSGVQLMINTCGAGEGNKMPFTVGADTPSPILPVLKMTGSEAHFNNADNCIDFSAECATDSGTLDRTAEKLVAMILGTASGQPSKTEWGSDFMMNIPVRYHQA